MSQIKKGYVQSFENEIPSRKRRPLSDEKSIASFVTRRNTLRQMMDKVQSKLVGCDAVHDTADLSL